jgi:hypothetical protein
MLEGKKRLRLIKETLQEVSGQIFGDVLKELVEVGMKRLEFHLT